MNDYIRIPYKKIVNIQPSLKEYKTPTELIDHMIEYNQPFNLNNIYRLEYPCKVFIDYKEKIAYSYTKDGRLNLSIFKVEGYWVRDDKFNKSVVDKMIATSIIMASKDELKYPYIEYEYNLDEGTVRSRLIDFDSLIEMGYLLKDYKIEDENHLRCYELLKAAIESDFDLSELFESGHAFEDITTGEWFECIDNYYNSKVNKKGQDTYLYRAVQEMAILDYLTLNDDRHHCNLGFVCSIEPDSLPFTLPIFDFNEMFSHLTIKFLLSNLLPEEEIIFDNYNNIMKYLNIVDDNHIKEFVDGEIIHPIYDFELRLEIPDLYDIDNSWYISNESLEYTYDNFLKDLDSSADKHEHILTNVLQNIKIFTIMREILFTYIRK